MQPSFNNQMPGVDANNQHNNTGELQPDGTVVPMAGYHAHSVELASIPKLLWGGSLSEQSLGLF